MKNESEKRLPLGKKNYIYMAISIVICVIGYMMMVGGGVDSMTEFNPDELYSFRRITLSVFFVLIGHSLMVYAIMRRDKESQQ